jgi:hypothetical protein
VRNKRTQPGVVIKYCLLIALPLLVLAAGCASNEPQQSVRAGAPYKEEIKGPAPRDSLLFSPADCIVR